MQGGKHRCSPTLAAVAGIRWALLQAAHSLDVVSRPMAFRVTATSINLIDWWPELASIVMAAGSGLLISVDLESKTAGRWAACRFTSGGIAGQ